MQKYPSKLTKISQVIMVLWLMASGLWLITNRVFALDNTSQKILDLRKQIEELTKQAEQYKGTIAEKQKQADTLKRQIDILNGQIVQLQLRISITGRQIDSTKIEISDLEGQIFDAGQKIDKQKQAIGELLSFLYERDQTDLFAAILQSPTLSAFTDQTQREQEFSDRLVGLVANLKIQKSSLESNKAQLDQRQADLEILNNKQIGQQASLSGNKKNKDTLLAQTRGQEAQYQKLLNETEKKQAEFFNELKNLEAQAVKSGAYIVHVIADSVPPRGTKIFQWPYDNYYISQGYGNTAYSLRGAYGGAPHNGIDMVSGYGSPIRPVGEGVVLASGFNNGWGNWVAIRHPALGNLVSVYAHMRVPSGLANGTSVSLGSIIGYEGSTGNATGSHLHLSIYRDFFTYINDRNGQLYFNYFDGTLNPLDYL